MILAFVFVATAAVTSAANKCDISCKIELGLRGDGAAALQVAEESKKTQSHEIIVNWYRISAENGSPEGQDTYANILVTESKSSYDCIRALYWYRQAAKNGNSHSASAARRLDALLQRRSEIDQDCKHGL